MSSNKSVSNMMSMRRRANIKSTLKHGQLKMLAAKLDVNSNYLSQLLSLKSDRPLSSEMAREIERHLELEPGILDQENMGGRLYLFNHKAAYQIPPVVSELLGYKMAEHLGEPVDVVPDYVVSEELRISAAVKGKDGDIKVVVSFLPMALSFALSQARVLLYASMAICGCDGLLIVETEDGLDDVWYSLESGKVEVKDVA